ncbi:MAG: cupin domain-containing protein [Ignavibacteriales bacterium]|nr:cupin domain-containing protein [Ignavibacteriales bacterium]
MAKQNVTLTRWNDIPLEPLNDLLARKLVTGERIMLAQVFLKKGCVVPAHSHENEQMTYILKGALQFEIEGKELIVREGEVLHIPSNIVHKATALEETLDLDVFSPPRQDWLNKTDEYLRNK